MKTRPPLTAESAILRELTLGERDIMTLASWTGHKRSTLQVALRRLLDARQVAATRVNGRAPILYRLTRAGKARWRQDEKYLREGRR